MHASSIRHTQRKQTNTRYKQVPADKKNFQRDSPPTTVIHVLTADTSTTTLLTLVNFTSCSQLDGNNESGSRRITWPCGTQPAPALGSKRRDPAVEPSNNLTGKKKRTRMTSTFSEIIFRSYIAQPNI